MRQAKRVVPLLLLLLLSAALIAAAQELAPPQPGFTIKFRYTTTKGTAPGDDTFRVVAVDSLRPPTPTISP